jgi:uncharacterized protein (DUF1778 family)
MKGKKKVKRHSFLIKVDPSDARLIKEAAARRRLSVNAFVGLASVGTARKVLQADPISPPLPEESISAEHAA